MENPTCQRCEKELPATHRVESEIIRLDVCDVCAAEAFGLPQTSPGRLSVMPLRNRPCACRAA